MEEEGRECAQWVAPLIKVKCLPYLMMLPPLYLSLSSNCE
jgi:hypothetical protein